MRSEEGVGGRGMDGLRLRVLTEGFSVLLVLFCALSRETSELRKGRRRSFGRIVPCLPSHSLSSPDAVLTLTAAPLDSLPIISFRPKLPHLVLAFLLFPPSFRRRQHVLQSFRSADAP